ncbi:DAK2 domain-containing protein [Solicola sp. PLA-1-18]|uniref:DAK2 domain-containing protein n=1 Tax=Solicola sp. PLA-1-18 TaxID=3380532 RepID=UPI003B7926CE
MTVPMTTAAFGLWARACVQALGSARAEIDALNVFPVPDSDTGTNVYLTFDAAAADAAPLVAAGDDLQACVRAFVDGALLAAKGNSGVIMAQLLRAMFGSLQGLSLDLSADDVARALRTAAVASYEAVGTPVEGTILSVASAAATGAEDAARDGGDAERALAAACAAARAALVRTPQQMPRLAEAGVVDAGGRALVVVLDTTERVLTGRWDPDREGSSPPHIPVPLPMSALPDGPGYEVTYLLDADDDAVSVLRETLHPLGDSLVVVGGDGIWNVHVHVDDVGAAIEAGVVAGRPHRIGVTHLHEQVRALAGGATPTRMVLAVTAGPGLTTLFTEAGATTLSVQVGDGVQARQVVEAVAASTADEVVLLPNGSDHVAPCEAAAHQLRDGTRHVAVVPTRTQVQGLAAVAVHEPGRDFSDDVIAMTSAAGHTQHGAVTFADAHGITMAGPCAPGDVLGVVDAEFSFVGQDVGEVAFEVVRTLMSGSAELVTLVAGEGLPDAVIEQLQRRVEATWPYVDTVTYDGGQRRYPLLLAVE